MTADRPLHVLMTADTVGGVWTYALDLAAGLRDAGMRVTLAVLGPPPSPAQTRAVQAADPLGMIVTGLPLDWLAETPDQVIKAGKALADLAQEVGADLVHLNSPALAAGAGFVQPVLGACHSCLATWWDACASGPLPEHFRWRTDRLAAGYRACDTLIAPTRAFAAATAAAYPGVRPAVVHNGRSWPAPGFEDERSACVITAGRLWDSGKNLAALDAVAERLSYPVVAVGPTRGPNGEQVCARRVRLLGPLPPEALAVRLAKAPVFASLALYEPFGLTVLEAAQSGCALVLSDIPSFRELWDGAAVFVDPRAPDQAAARIEALLDDPGEAARRGYAARRRAQGYTLGAMTAGTLAAYASAAAPLRESVA